MNRARKDAVCKPARRKPVNTGRKQAAKRTVPKADTRFKPGQSGNPAGRPKGSRNKLSEAFLRDFCALWEELGDMALRRVARNDPSTFVLVAARLVPKEVTGPEDGPHIVEIRWKDPDLAVVEPGGGEVPT
jgi:hypothetical protein